MSAQKTHPVGSAGRAGLARPLCSGLWLGGDLAQSRTAVAPCTHWAHCQSPDTYFPLPALANTPHNLPAPTCGSEGMGGHPDTSKNDPVSEMTTNTHSSPVKTLGCPAAPQEPDTDPDHPLHSNQVPAVSWLQHLGPHLGDTVPGGNQPQVPLLESTWTSGLTHRRPEARTQTPSLQRQVGTSGGWTGLSRGSLQHARPLRRAARRREG